MKKRMSFAILLTMAVLAVQAQMVNPVRFTSQLKQLKGNEAELTFSANIDAGWHVYSTGLGDDGPISASFHAVKMEGAETVGTLHARGKEIKQFDPMFDMELRYFEHAVTFVQKVKFTKPTYDIECFLEYGACNDRMCMPPSEVELKAKGNSPLAKEEEKPQEETSQEEKPVVSEVIPADSLPTDTATVASSVDDGLWQPVVSELRAMGGDSTDVEGRSLWYLLLMGFVGGLLAVCMPCIWPIIPMTVSFFLKRAKTDKQKGIRDAITYGLSIVVIYLGLGLLVTALFGSDT